MMPSVAAARSPESGYLLVLLIRLGVLLPNMPAFLDGDRCEVRRRTQLRSPSLLGGERVLGAFGNRLPIVLGDDCK